MQALVDIFSEHSRLGIGTLVAGIVTWVMIMVMRKAASRIGLVANPGQHRGHSQPTPLIGGIAMFVGIVIGMMCLDIPLAGMRAFFVGALLVVVMGVLDDMNEIPASVRFVPQIASGLIMTLWGGVVLYSLGNLMYFDFETTLGSMAIAITVFACVGLINAINMSDGTDGQSGLLVLVSLVGLLMSVFISGRVDVLPVASIVSVCVVVFLTFNMRTPWRNQASIFMGDSGSMLLGFVVCWLLVHFSQGNPALGIEPAIRPVTALWLVALPLLDTVTVMLRRTLEGGSPFKADRTHYHHLLRAADLGINETIVVITVTAINFAGFGLVGEAYGVPEVVMFYTFVFVFTIWFCGSYYAVNALRAANNDFIMMRDRRASNRDRIPGGVDRRQGPRNRRTDERPQEESVAEPAADAEPGPAKSEA